MRNQHSAFTLIELLVVIAIIAILAAILFPVFAQAKAAAKKTVSLSNVKQQELAILMYDNDNNDTNICEWPYYEDWNNPITDANHTFHPYINVYVKSKDLWTAPGSAAVVSQPIYGTTNGVNTTGPTGGGSSHPSGDEEDGLLTGGFSMSYLMNETGWSDGVNYDHLNQFNNAGLNTSVFPAPADEIQLFEAEGSKFWMGSGYQVALSWNGGNSTIPQPSNPNQSYPISPVINSGGTVTTPGLYNTPGADWGGVGITDFVNYRYGTPGIVASFFDGHAKFLTHVVLKEVQPYYYDQNNIATNWTN